jgi:hypothetical protein
MGIVAPMARGPVAAGDEVQRPGHGFGLVPPTPHLAVL